MAPVRNTRGRSTLSEIQCPEGRLTRNRRRSLEELEEQIRKDEELARRLESGETDALAEETLSPEQIAAILGNDYHDPRNRPTVENAHNPAASVNVRRQLTPHVSHRPAAALGHAYRAGRPTVMTITRRRVQVIHVQQTDDNDTHTELQLDDDANETITVDADEEHSDSGSDVSADDDNQLAGDSFISHDDNGDLDSDSDEDEEDDDDLNESVRDTYQGELELIENDLPTTSRNHRRSNAASSGIVHRPNALRTDKYGQCTICFEDKPADPMSCIHCKQLVGCDGCVQQWWNIGVEAKKNGPQTYADGHPPNNHFQCPLCRHTWKRKPQVVSSAKY